MPRCSKDFICSDSLEVSSAIVLSAIHKFECLNHKTKRTICKICRLSVTKNYFYNVSPQTSTLLLLLRSGDVSTNPGPLKANGSIRRRTLVVVAAKVSLPAVEQSRVTPAGRGHTTDVQVCSAVKRIMRCATAEIILIFNCPSNSDNNRHVFSLPEVLRSKFLTRATNNVGASMCHWKWSLGTKGLHVAVGHCLNR